MNPEWKKGCEIIDSLVRDLWKRGYVFSLASEEEVEITASPDQDVEEIIGLATDLEISWLSLFDLTDNMVSIGTVMFLPGNGSECISDYGGVPILDDLVRPYLDIHGR